MTDINIDSKLKREFYKYVYNNINWEFTKEEDYELYYEEIFQSCTLFEIFVIDETEEEYNRLFKSKGIEYFIFEYFYITGDVERDFHVYENGEFREVTPEEDNYLRDIEDVYEIYYGDQNGLLYFHDEDYVDISKRVNKSFIKMNENKMKTFKQFNENLEDGYSEEFDRNFSEIESLTDSILELTDEYVEEELKLMDVNQLLDILGNLQQDRQERNIDSIQYRMSEGNKYGGLTKTENTLRHKIDDLILYYEKSKYDVELDDLKNKFTGDIEYMEKCNKIIECLKNL
jgi:hypothetical protein